ncbi:MAG: hypothetical protein GY822_17910 [Deltaproteobacteria bacterium]|nr:hypothetical protein [Deltaproteobacteria bacterium]
MSSSAKSTTTTNSAEENRVPLFRKLAARFFRVTRLVRYFFHPARFVLLPFLGVMLLAGIFLWLTGGLAYVAPFAYSLF